MGGRFCWIFLRRTFSNTESIAANHTIINTLALSTWYSRCKAHFFSILKKWRSLSSYSVSGGASYEFNWQYNLYCIWCVSVPGVYSTRRSDSYDIKEVEPYMNSMKKLFRKKLPPRKRPFKSGITSVTYQGSTEKYSLRKAHWRAHPYFKCIYFMAVRHFL